MKKHPDDYTPGEAKFAKRFNDLAASQPNALIFRKNVATTLAGDFVIGLTYRRNQQIYSATAIEINGVRDNGKLCTWDREGGALECDLSDLNMESVHSEVKLL